jgi:hypothetical protein
MGFGEDVGVGDQRRGFLQLEERIDVLLSSAPQAGLGHVASSGGLTTVRRRAL